LTGSYNTEQKFVYLSWNSAAHAAQYEVMVAVKPKTINETPKWKRVAKVDILFYGWYEAKQGNTYLFCVRGVTHYRQGEFSNVVEIAIP
jgi:hypothetical protein